MPTYKNRKPVVGKQYYRRPTFGDLKQSPYQTVGMGLQTPHCLKKNKIKLKAAILLLL